MNAVSRPAMFVAGAAIIAACGGSDSKKKSGLDVDGGDAAVGAGGRGAGGRPGAGGVGTGGRGSGGLPGGGAGGVGAGGLPEAGAGGAPEAGPDVSIPEAGPEASPEAEAGLVCRPFVFTDSGAVAEGGVGEWRDWAQNTCRACPLSLDCDHFAQTSSIFDVVTRQLTLAVAPSVAEIHVAAFSFYWEAVGADGGIITGNVAAKVMNVDRDTLTVDLSADIPLGVYYISNITLDIDDACEQHWVFTDILNLFASSTPVDGGPGQNIFCEQ